MTTHNREIQAPADNSRAPWRKCFVAAFFVATLGATADAAIVTFNDPTPTPDGENGGGDTFGWSVALDGNNVLIGAPWDDTFGETVGQAHLFDAVTGNLLHTYNDPTPTPDGTHQGGDAFGNSVALDGNNVLIGARWDDTLGDDVGQAHLFDAVTGNLLRTFNNPTPTSGDLFGNSVALDGNNVLIGAGHDQGLGDDVGQAHLFDAVTGNLLRTFNAPTVTESALFGISVALDGNNVLIGANHDDTLGPAFGQAHLFDAVTGNLLQTFTDPTPTQDFYLNGIDFFGRSVALVGNNVLIGAPYDDTLGTSVGQAHLFDAVTGNLLRTFNDPTPTPGGFVGDNFGWSVALDGNNVLIGAFRDDTLGDNVGQAHLFDAVTGNLLQTFNDPITTPGVDHNGADRFGISVALDGNNVLIGAERDDTLGRNVGQAHLFTFIPDNELSGFGHTYTQDFDALGTASTSPGTPLPFGWSTNNAGTINTETTVRFPSASVVAGTYNAGADADRTLATGNNDREAANAIYFTGSFTGPLDVRAIVFQSRIEAWHGDMITPPDNPGEAAFVISLLLDPDGDGTFSTAHTFNDGAPVTTGLTLGPGVLDGNGAAGTSFASGLVELPTAIPAGSDFRLAFDAQNAGQTQGYIFGVDDVLFRIVAPGDTDGNGEVDSDDLFAILGAGKFNHPELGPASWGEGDFTGDDLVNSDDLFAMLGAAQFNAGPYTTATSTAALATVPEPSTFVLAAIGLVGLLAFAERRQR